MRGLIRYAPRLLLDHAMTRGAAMVAVAFVFILPASLAGIGEAPDEELARGLSELLGTLGVFFTLLASYGLIGADIRQGSYRFIFAKPISPVPYYAVSYALATIVFLLGLLAAVGVFALLVRPVWPGTYILDVLVNYGLLSAIVLVFSRVTNGDWLIALVVLGLSTALRASYPADESMVGKVLHVVLPPTQHDRLFPPAGVNWDGLMSMLGYTAFLLAVVFLIVRKVPMGSAR